MDWLIDNEALSLWLTHYGSVAIFGLLALGIIALPVPEETLMMLAGILIANGKLHGPGTVLMAYAGSISGITCSYWIGRSLGHFLIVKYGSWIGLTAAKLEKAHQWFQRFGKWSLFIGYFIPGVRHFTGITAGIADLEYKSFAIYAYTGAIVWATFFISIGYFLGDHWILILDTIKNVVGNTELIIETSLVIGALSILMFLIFRHFIKTPPKRDSH